MKKILSVVLILAMVAMVGCGGKTSKETETEVSKSGEDLTFVIVPKCVHEWFEAVNVGAEAEAKALSKQLGVDVSIKYMAPAVVDITEQNAILEQAAALHPAGIAIDPIDFQGSKAVIESIQAQGVPVVLFDAAVPGSGLCAIGNDFAEQAELEARKLAELLEEKGEIAIMHGATTAPNHCERYETFQKVLAEYPDITVIEGGASNDSIEVAQEQATAIMAANPNLKGFLCVDASAPIGISAAIEEAGKQDQITFVGAENLLQILEYIKSGTMVCSYSTKPQMQGSLAVLAMFQAHMGMKLPQFIDTGSLYIDETNVDEWIEKAEKGEY